MVIKALRSSGSQLGLKCISLSNGGQLYQCQLIYLSILSVSIIYIPAYLIDIDRWLIIMKYDMMQEQSSQQIVYQFFVIIFFEGILQLDREIEMKDNEEIKENQEENVRVQFDKIREKLVGNCQYNQSYYQGTSRLQTSTPIPTPLITQQKKHSNKSLRCSPLTCKNVPLRNIANNDYACIKNQIKQLQQMATGIAAYHKQSELYKRKYQIVTSCKHQNRNFFKNPIQQLNEEIRCIDSKRDQILIQINQQSPQLSWQSNKQQLHHNNSKKKRTVLQRRRFVRDNQNIVLTNIKKQQAKNNYMGQMLKICQNTKQPDKMLQIYIKEVGEISIETRQHPLQLKKNSKVQQNNPNQQYCQNSIPDQFMKTLNSSDYGYRWNRNRSQSNQPNKMKKSKEMSGCWTPDSTPRISRYGLSVGKICTKIRQIDSKCETKRDMHKKSNRLFSKRCFNRHSPNNSDFSGVKNMIKYM